MITQSRISLITLKVASFASEETWCFEAKVCLDGNVIATARNDGQGGCTIIHPLPGMKEKLSEAMSYARTLPPVECPFDDPVTTKPATIDVNLELVIDELVSDAEMKKKIRSQFKRDFPKKLLLIDKGEMYSITKINLKEVKDKPALFEKIRCTHGKDIIILAELSETDAYDAYLKHSLAN